MRLRAGWPTFLCVLAIIAAAALAEVAITPAYAQDRPLTLFDLLFGRRQPTQPQTRQNGQSKRRSYNPVTRRSPSASSGPATSGNAPAVAKLNNARKILVVGDFTAGALADGLTVAFANSPGVTVVDRSHGSSGFVRDDYYDWPGQIQGILDEVKPAAVAVMIGSNDDQQMKVNGAREAVGSAGWTTEYTRRVQSFADTIRKDGYPLVWVGEPPFRYTSMSDEMVALNNIYRAIVENVGGTYVDIWEGFADDAGNFTISGFDINGQTVRLRSNDGINFTKAARRKIAFYAEKPLRQILGSAASPDIASLSPPGGPAALPKSRGEIHSIPPIGFDNPAFDGSRQLLGATDNKPVEVEKSLRDKLVEDGTPPPAQPGRVDDFSWPPGSADLIQDKPATKEQPTAQSMPAAPSAIGAD